MFEFVQDLEFSTISQIFMPSRRSGFNKILAQTVRVKTKNKYCLNVKLLEFNSVTITDDMNSSEFNHDRENAPLP